MWEGRIFKGESHRKTLNTKSYFSLTRLGSQCDLNVCTNSLQKPKLQFAIAYHAESVNGNGCTFLRYGSLSQGNENLSFRDWSQRQKAGEYQDRCLP